MSSRIKNIHPGEVLSEEFLKPLEISAYRLSKETGIPQSRLSAIIKGQRSISADTALRFSRFLGTTAKFWLALQNDYDLEETACSEADALRKIRRFKPSDRAA